MALGVTSCALIMRQSRSAMLEVLGQDYMRTARAKGVAELRVLEHLVAPHGDHVASA